MARRIDGTKPDLDTEDWCRRLDGAVSAAEMNRLAVEVTEHEVPAWVMGPLKRRFAERCVRLWPEQCRPRERRGYRR